MLFFTLLAFLSLSIVSHAQVGELSPDVYDAWKESAEDVVYLEIESVDERQNEYEVSATVKDIVRSQSDLAVDDIVTFTTYNETDSNAGPSAPITLMPDMCVLAYLNATGGRYSHEIAAGGESFEDSPDMCSSGMSSDTPTSPTTSVPSDVVSDPMSDFPTPTAMTQPPVADPTGGDPSSTPAPTSTRDIQSSASVWGTRKVLLLSSSTIVAIFFSQLLSSV